MAITSIGYNASFTGNVNKTPNKQKAATAAKIVVAAGAGAAVTAIGITKGKNIEAFFKKIKMPAKLQEFVSKVGTKIKKGFNKTGEYAKKALAKVKKFFTGLFSKKVEDRISYGPLRNKVMKESGEEVVKNFNTDNSAAWLNTFKKRYPTSSIELMPRK